MDIDRRINILKRYDARAYEIAESCYWGPYSLIDSNKHKLRPFLRDRRQAQIALMIHELFAERHGRKRDLNKDEFKCLHGTGLNARSTKLKAEVKGKLPDFEKFLKILKLRRKYSH
jgi:hypothetical protein